MILLLIRRTLVNSGLCKGFLPPYFNRFFICLISEKKREDGRPLCTSSMYPPRELLSSTKISTCLTDDSFPRLPIIIIVSPTTHYSLPQTYKPKHAHIHEEKPRFVPRNKPRVRLSPPPPKKKFKQKAGGEIFSWNRLNRPSSSTTSERKGGMRKTFPFLFSRTAKERRNSGGGRLRGNCL